MKQKNRLFNFINRSLQTKVIFGVVLPSFLILVIFITIEFIRLQDVILDQLSSISSFSGEIIEGNLRHEMVESDRVGIQIILDSMKETEEFQIIYVLDIDGRVIFSPNNESLGEHIDNLHPDCQICHNLSLEQRPSSVIITNQEGDKVFRSMVAINNSEECAQCHDPNQKLLGLLLTDISVAPYQSELISNLRENFFWWFLIILATMFFVNFAIRRFILQRLEGVAEAIGDFGATEKINLVVDNQPDEIGKLVGSFNSMAERVERRSEENRSLSENLRKQSNRRENLLNLLITAQEDERKRLARDLHDELGQSLAALAIQAELLERLIPTDKTKAIDQLNQINSLIKASTDNMYNLILDLRPSSLDDLGLEIALRSYSERILEKSGIVVNISSDNLDERLPPKIEITLFRIYQEALINVLRHANATQVNISLACRNGFFEGEITDDGQGFDFADIVSNENNPRGLGLLGMQERVDQCSGKLEIISSPGMSTKILISIPI